MPSDSMPHEQGVNRNHFAPKIAPPSLENPGLRFDLIVEQIQTNLPIASGPT
jgi:hypothetical protein